MCVSFCNLWNVKVLGEKDAEEKNTNSNTKEDYQDKKNLGILPRFEDKDIYKYTNNK